MGKVTKIQDKLVDSVCQCGRRYKDHDWHEGGKCPVIDNGIPGQWGPGVFKRSAAFSRPWPPVTKKQAAGEATDA